MNLIDVAESGLIPDPLVRVGIRRLLFNRLEGMTLGESQPLGEGLAKFAEQLRSSPLAVSTEAANDQHYEVPTEFFQHVLGPRLKYSCCLFPNPQISLAEAEEVMLRTTCERAELKDGIRILELGCGWGSLTLWMAAEYPNSRVTAVSNSHSQREFIESSAAAQGLRNVRVQTVDMTEFDTTDQFERIVSVEMFEHMRNYELLLRRVCNWLSPGGKAFVHVFCHRSTPYLFESEGAANWMGRHFFTGGIMPSEDLFGCFDEDLEIEEQWRVNGMHYWRTSLEWLRNLDRNRSAILARFRQDLSARDSKTQLQRWRMFFMACAELFRYHQGNEWFVAHYRFRQKLAVPA